MDITTDIITDRIRKVYPGLKVIVTFTASDSLILNDDGTPFLFESLPGKTTYLPGSDKTATDALMIQVHRGGFDYTQYLLAEKDIVPKLNENGGLIYAFNGTAIALSDAEALARTGTTVATATGPTAYQTVRFFDGQAFGTLNIYKDHISLVL